MGEEAYSRHDHFIPDGRAIAITYAYGVVKSVMNI